MPRRDTGWRKTSVTTWPRFLAAFALLLLLYQASEALQTRFVPGHPVGPALMVCALLAAWPLGRWMGWRGLDAYGLENWRHRLSLLAGGLAVALLAKLASIPAAEGMGLVQEAASAAGLSVSFVILAALTTFVPSLAEDILTRGMLLRSLPMKLSAPAFVLASSVLYVVNHLWRFGWGWTEQVRLLCLGLAYAAAAWKWRTLWAAVALHWGWNLGGVLAERLMPVTTLDPDGARLLSAAVHLLLLVGILAAPPRAVRS